MPIVEKAYAQWNETGHEGRDGSNTYAALTSGYMNLVDQQVLGVAATTYSPVASDLATKQAVIAAIQSGKAVTAAIFLSGDPTVFSQLGLVSCHAYEIASYDADPNSPTYDTFQLENPWGWHEPLPLTWSQLCRVWLDRGGQHVRDSRCGFYGGRGDRGDQRGDRCGVARDGLCVDRQAEVRGRRGCLGELRQQRKFLCLGQRAGHAEARH